MGFSGLGNPVNLAYLPLSGGTLTGDLTLPSAGKLIFGARGSISASADGKFTLLDTAGTGFTLLNFGGTTSSFPALKRVTGNLQVRRGDDTDGASLTFNTFANAGGGTTVQFGDGSGNWNTTVLGQLRWNSATGVGSEDTGLKRAAAGIVAATNASTGTGDFQALGSVLTAGIATVTKSSLIRSVVHQFDITNAMVVALGASLTGDVAVATLPAKTLVKNAYVVVTGTAAGVATLSGAVGRASAAYIDYIVASDMKVAANIVYGDTSAERGTNLTGYDLPSFTGPTIVNMHFISTVQNLSLTTGFSCSVYIETVTLP